jgi:hypothetical protein
MANHVDVYLETTARKTFACALEWPGWCRSGKTEEFALETLTEYLERYRPVVEQAGQRLPATITTRIVERIEGGAGTEFGVPSAIAARDRSRVTAREADRLAAIVSASWATLNRIAPRAPAELRKGPRGGGRDRDTVVLHVAEADQAYAREIGLRERMPDPGDTKAIAALRERMLDVLRQPSDGSPLVGRKWTHRYAARRIAWHALDHAWEIEDRSTPSP